MKFIIQEQKNSQGKFLVCAEDEQNEGMCSPYSPAALDLDRSQAIEALKLAQWAYKRGYQKKAEQVNAAIRAIHNEDPT